MMRMEYEEGLTSDVKLTKAGTEEKAEQKSIMRSSHLLSKLRMQGPVLHFDFFGFEVQDRRQGSTCLQRCRCRRRCSYFDQVFFQAESESENVTLIWAVVASSRVSEALMQLDTNG